MLGSIAGFTIFLGLPLAVLQNVSPKKKGFLNAIAIGILVFLIIDVFDHAWDSVGNVAQDTFSGKVSVSTGVPTILALFGGLAIGLLGLVFYEERYMKKNLKQKWSGLDSSVASSGGEYQHQLQLLQEGNALADKTTVFVPMKPLLTYFTTDGFSPRSIPINYPDNK